MIAVRAYVTTDAESVQLIMASCTRQLRAVYVPIQHVEIASDNHSSSNLRVVAVDRTDTVIGVAEYISHPSALYAQGIAVDPLYRRRGVARALLNHIAKLAVGMDHIAVEVATIKETGNVDVFKRLGFSVIEERASQRFLDQLGQPVSEVTLKRYVA